jgi:hypothetical protein
MNRSKWPGMMTLLAFLVSGTAIGQAKSGESSMHVESTSKNKGPGSDTKTKTESVIGTVKSYVAGEKITVTGPKNKDYTFDLSENVATKGSIAVGGRVKVTYSKTDGGDRVTTVVAYTTASHLKKTRKTAA